MAGQAANLGFNPGSLFQLPTDRLRQLASPVQAQPGIDKAQTARLNLDDPASLEAEAERQMRMGNLNEALRFRQMAAQHRQMAAQQSATLTAGNAEIQAEASRKAAKQGQMQLETARRKEVYDRLIAAGQKETANMVRLGVIDAAAGAKVLVSVEGENRRADIAAEGEQRRATLNDSVARERAMGQLKADREELRVGMFTGLSQGSDEAITFLKNEGISPDDPKAVNEYIQSLSAAEVAVIKSITSTSAFKSADSNAHFGWGSATEAMKNEVYDQTWERLGDWVNEKGLKGQDDDYLFIDAEDADVGAYAELVARAASGLMEANPKLSQEAAAEVALQVLQATYNPGDDIAMMAENVGDSLNVPISEVRDMLATLNSKGS